MKSRNRNFKKVDAPFNFWPSFADVMSTIVLVFFLLMLLVLIVNIITGDELKETRATLETREEDIIEKEKAIRILESQLDFEQLQLSISQDKLEASEKKLEASNKQLVINLDKLDKSIFELDALKTKLQDISVLRVDILNKVKEAIEFEIGSIDDNGNSNVSIGENANIIIGASVVFAYDSAELSSEGKSLLRKFATAFEKVLSQKDIRDSISSINIEGHTDGDGTPQYNMELASKRAYNVTNYLFAANPDLEKNYGKYFSSTAYSMFRPIAGNITEADKRKNRRIEISVTVRDPNIKKIIDDFLLETGNIVPDN
jgi:chemotaxis protein MotB